MGFKYIMVKKSRYIHATTRLKKEKLLKDGWKHIITLNGWNMSISYET